MRSEPASKVRSIFLEQIGTLEPATMAPKVKHKDVLNSPAVSTKTIIKDVSGRLFSCLKQAVSIGYSLPMCFKVFCRMAKSSL